MSLQERETEVDYLRHVERLARAVVGEVAREEWLEFGVEDESSAAPIQRAINELATALRFVHHEGDGCTDHWLCAHRSAFGVASRLGRWSVPQMRLGRL